MARKTLYDRLDSLDVNIANEYNSLIKLLKIEKRFGMVIETIP